MSPGGCQRPSPTTWHLALVALGRACVTWATSLALCHLALGVRAWHRAQPTYCADIDVPMFPTVRGLHPSKASAVETFEILGSSIGQPFVSATELRLFGGHTSRVTGARELAACGLEVAKIRIMALHSGDAILRYVAEAPLRSLRADLGLNSSSSGRSLMPFGPEAARSSSALVRARIRKLEATVARLEAELQTQSRHLVGLATGYARTDARVFIQNTVIAAIHYAVANDNRSTVCGWPFASARNQGAGPTYRTVPDLVGIPGHLMCEPCLPTEQAIVLSTSTAELSGDE